MNANEDKHLRRLKIDGSIPAPGRWTIPMKTIVSVDRSRGSSEIIVEFSDGTLATYTVDELIQINPGGIPEEPPSPPIE